MSSSFRSQPSQTVAKALAILGAFSSVRPERGVRELGRDLGINPATVSRLVTTLANEGYLEQNPENQRYSLGPRVMKLASLYSLQNPISIVARRVFESYADRFEHNFYLGKLVRFEVAYMAVLDGRGPIRVVVQAGRGAPLHATATGKLLLAYQDDSMIRDYLAGRKLDSFTPRTVTDPERLWEEIGEIRQREYAVNDGELFDDIGAVTVPVFDHGSQTTLGVCLAYPRHHVGPDRIQVEALIPLAKEIAEVIYERTESLHMGTRSAGHEVPASLD